MKDINARIAKITFRPGVHMTQGGEVDSRTKCSGRFFSALGIAVMLILILVMQFGSFLEPLAIMISLPLSSSA